MKLLATLTLVNIFAQVALILALAHFVFTFSVVHGILITTLYTALEFSKYFLNKQLTNFNIKL